MQRRVFLTACAGAALFARAGYAHDGEHPFSRSPEAWRAQLTDLEYKVMREMGTEPAGSSPLDDVHAEGTFHCKGCDQGLYPSRTKFDSGTGWPSFWAPIGDEVVGTQPDRGFFTTRTEVHCSNCGSHMGHIFDDGPEPTGKRHCLNGVAMVFRPSGPGEPVIG